MVVDSRAGWVFLGGMFHILRQLKGGGYWDMIEDRPPDIKDIKGVHCDNKLLSHRTKNITPNLQSNQNRRPIRKTN